MKKQHIDKEISAKPVNKEPETTFEMINKYGTYEIQPTAETENEYPKIAQGFPKKQKKSVIKKFFIDKILILD